MKFIILNILLVSSIATKAQTLKWKNVSSLYGLTNKDIQLYESNDSLNQQPNRAFYCIINLKNKKIKPFAAVGNGKRYTPDSFYKMYNNPTVVVNCTFFEFKENKNLNVVVHKGKLLSYNQNIISKKLDSTKPAIQYYNFRSAIGFNKKSKIDIAWIHTDSSKNFIGASQNKISPQIIFTNKELEKKFLDSTFKKWKVRTAVGGGPVLIQNGESYITNNEEFLFAGNSINDKHPRTAMGYTANNQLIILVVEGRNKGIADGVDLVQEAKILKDLGCIEALNLDGGGSSCLLINGKPTIKVSDKTGQRPVPAVFMIK